MIWVTGCPRSGTSMLMQILDAGGYRVRAANQRPRWFNVHGVWEDPVSRSPAQMAALVGEAVAVKVFPRDAVAALAGGVAPGRVLVPMRPLAECQASWELAFPGRPWSEEGPRGWRDGTGSSLADALKAFAVRGVPVLRVGFHALIDNPVGICGEIAEFLGGVLGAGATAVSDPNLRHHGLVAP